MNFSEKIKNIRDECGYENKYFQLKIYEYFLITTCLFIKEIIELIIATVKKFIWFFSNSSKSFFSLFYLSNAEQTLSTGSKGIESLFSNIPLLKEKIFWIWIFKILINLLILIYFLLKYGKKFLLSDGMLLWIFITLNPITDLLISILQKYTTLNIFSYFLEFLKLGMLPLIIFYFVAVDKVLIDSWKLIFYENLNYCSISNRYTKNENSFFSKKKVKQLFKWIFISLMVIVLCDMIIHGINSLVSNENKELTTKNQTALEQEFKKNKLSVLFSVVVIAPIMEELLMRKCLMSLGKLRWFTIINSAFLFGLIHLSNEDIFHLLPYLISGLVFAFLYWSTNNIWNSIFTHATFNLIAWIVLIFKV